MNSSGNGTLSPPSRKDLHANKDLNQPAEKERHCTAVSLSEHQQIFATSSLAATMRVNVIAQELSIVYTAEIEGKHLIK